MNERTWMAVMNAVDSLLWGVEWATDVVAEAFQWASGKAHYARYRWKCAVRPKAGLTPDGLTREQVARREAKRAETLRKMGRPDLIGESHDAL